jgi:long-chain acyl-CoA synthetase
VVARLLETFQRYADRPCIVDALGGRTLTYGEADGLARASAAALRSKGVGQGDRVALLLANGPELAVLYLACLYLGAVAVPVNPSLPRSEVDLILRGAGPRVTVDAWTLPREGADLEPTPVRDEDLFLITFTSGTTSTPKGVAHTAGTLLGAAAAFDDHLGFGPDNRFLHVLPMTYMAGILNTLLCPLACGGSVVLARAFDARSVLDFWRPVKDHEADTFWLAPSMLAALERIDRDPSGPAYCRERARAVCVGTAPLPPKLKRDAEEKYGVELLESYGLSELLFVTASSPRWPRIEGSVGRVLEGVAVRVADDEELLVRTPYAMAGYLDLETGCPDPLPADGWFPTGDLGRIDEDGNVFVSGRKKDLIIRGGVNVSPRRVEEVLTGHGAIARAAVVGMPHDLWGEEVVAVVELAPGRELDSELDSLVALCRSELAEAAVPSRFVAVDALPVSSTGKVKKAELRERFLVRPS